MSNVDWIFTELWYDFFYPVFSVKKYIFVFRTIIYINIGRSATRMRCDALGRIDFFITLFFEMDFFASNAE